ncbi:MAG: regulatory protein RecX [Rhodospirillales bacterium]|nr:regulatory protein RecX [Alphaproteobacteria bacterium]MBL6948117.1 regulatory protein RecX [Rhodospirillales bacterium]
MAKEFEKPRVKIPRKATPRYLENSALHYLSRFASSSENFRRLMTRKVDRSAKHHDTDPDEGRALIDDMIQRFLRSGLLDDTAYAKARAAGLHRRGNASRIIRAKLKQKGLGDDVIEQALAALADDDEDPERTAAIRFARRRRLGPFATEKPEDPKREKQLAAMARAGFSYDLARRIVDADSEDDLQF